MAITAIATTVFILTIAVGHAGGPIDPIDTFPIDTGITDGAIGVKPIDVYRACVAGGFACIRTCITAIRRAGFFSVSFAHT